MCAHRTSSQLKFRHGDPRGRGIHRAIRGALAFAGANLVYGTTSEPAVTRAVLSGMVVV